MLEVIGMQETLKLLAQDRERVEKHNKHINEEAGLKLEQGIETNEANPVFITDEPAKEEENQLSVALLGPQTNITSY